MYRTIILAYDGTIEGRLALREGARLAQMCKARVILMAVVDPKPEVYVGDFGTILPIDDRTPDVHRILDEGMERLKRMGLTPEARLEIGDAAERIERMAQDIGADLVVVGHHKQGAFARWLLGSVTTTLSNRLGCSLLIARHDIPDDVLFPPTAQKTER